MKEIKVACKGAGVLDIAQIVDFQGNLKRRGIEDIEKLKTSITTLSRRSRQEAVQRIERVAES